MSKNRSIDRRSALYFILASLASINVAVIAKPKQSNPGSPKKDFRVVGKRSLKQRAASKGLIYGVAGTYLDISPDKKLLAAIAQEGGMLVADWELKWAVGDKPLRPSPTSFDFTRADWMVKFARTHGMLLRGHTLVWHESLPDWFKEKANSQNAKQFLTQHIERVVGRYAGKMHSWDVVNEAIDIASGHPDSLRTTPWLELLGSDYIEMAFRAAAKADPKALLVYNDYGFEYDTPQDEAKRVAVLKLIKRLKSKGVPIQALGIQAHLDAAETRFSPKKLQKFLRDVANLGLKILITELDVNDTKLPLNFAVRDRIVAKVYDDFLSTVLNEKAVIAVVTWGLSDRHTWLSDKPRADRAPVRPLPLDANLKPKLAWSAIANAFDRAPKR
jgi:endo-1,4-beta-xylanase